jgi:hypothetical protein
LSRRDPGVKEPILMHPLKQAGEASTVPEQRPTAALAAERVRPYLRVPDRLLRSYVCDPLAVGIYIAVARCALAERATAPLSANDLVAWTGGAHHRAALMRRIQRLIADGWLIVAREQTVKHRLLPTWGSHCPWQLNDPKFGKPSDVRIRRVPLDLLDSYLGRCDPQPGRRPALITRYFDQPLIDLADLGAYAIAAIATVEPSQRLQQLGLLCDGEQQALLSLDDLLAAGAAGGLRMTDEGVTSIIRLSTFGWRRLRQIPDDTDGEPDLQSGSPSGSGSGSRSRSVSGSLSRSVSGSHELSSGTVVYAFSERVKPCIREATASYAWDSWNPSMEGMNLPPMDRGGVGGGSLLQQNQQKRAHPNSVTPEIAAMLRAMGVRNPATLAGVPAELIAQWQAVVSHPGMQTRFSDPVAFASTQMKQGATPPAADELERWAQGSQQRTDGNQSWRYIPPVEASPEAVQHSHLAERARTIAPAGASALEMLDLFTFLSEGASDTEALERLAAKQATAEAQASDEEVYRALIARTSRR